MGRRIKLIKHHTLAEWQELIPKVQNLETRFRMLAIERVLVNPEISSKEICKQFYITAATFFRWLSWYNEGSFEKLKEGNGGKGSKGSKTIYDEEIFETLGKEINSNQNMVWTLEKMQTFIKNKYSVEPTLQAIRYRIKDTHSYKSSRPYPYKADRNKLGQFKKTV
jgi:transposase